MRAHFISCLSNCNFKALSAKVGLAIAMDLERGEEDSESESLGEVLRDRFRISTISIAEAEGGSIIFIPFYIRSLCLVAEKAKIKRFHLLFLFQRNETEWKYPNPLWLAFPIWPSNMQVGLDWMSLFSLLYFIFFLYCLLYLALKNCT